MKAPARTRDDASLTNPLTVDVSCGYCGREPSHPQIRYRFAYAAYYQRPSLFAVAPRSYVAALCGPCAEADRRTGARLARNRFLALVSQWSGLEMNRGQIVRLLEYPEDGNGEEREGDACFQDGELCSYRALTTPRPE